MSAGEVDLSGFDLPALLHLQAVLPPLIALREVVEPKGGSVRVSLTGPREMTGETLRRQHPDWLTSEGPNPFDQVEAPGVRRDAPVEGEARPDHRPVDDGRRRTPAAQDAGWPAGEPGTSGEAVPVSETVAPMQTPPQGAAATDDPALAGVAAPADAGHPLPATSSPDAVKPAPAVDSSLAAGDPGPVDRLTAYLAGVPRRGPWTLATDCDLMKRVCDGAKVAEIALDVGGDAGVVRNRIKVLTDGGKWRPDAVHARLSRLVQV
jgi:hypothetical protein